MTFSVLVPVYNVEKYLRICVDSLLNQKFQDYEIILYDDKSKDNSGRICDEYQKKFPERIQVVHGFENIGLCPARIELVKYARGDYCIFVDADDFVSSALLSCVNSAIQQFHTDIVMYDMYVHYEFRMALKRNKAIRFRNDNYLYTDMQSYYESLSTFKINAIWRKAFKREIWNHIRFNGLQNEIQIAEDLYFTLNLLKYTNSIYYISKPLYYYRCNFSSMTHVFKINRIFDKLKVFDYFIKEIKNTSNYNKKIENNIFRHISDSLIQFIRTMSSESCDLEMADLRKVLLTLSEEQLVKNLVEEHREQISPEQLDVIMGLYRKDFSSAERLIKQNKFYFMSREYIGKMLLK